MLNGLWENTPVSTKDTLNRRHIHSQNEIKLNFLLKSIKITSGLIIVGIIYFD